MEEKGYGGKPMVTHLFTQIEICLIEVAVIAIDQQGKGGADGNAFLSRLTFVWNIFNYTACLHR